MQEEQEAKATAGGEEAEAAAADEETKAAAADEEAEAAEKDEGKKAQAAGTGKAVSKKPSRRPAAPRVSQVLPRPDKQKIIAKFRRAEKDVGSSEVQISLMSARIEHLTSHLKEHPKDKHTERGLMLLVNKRRRLLDYLSATKPDSYGSLLSQLNLRR